MNFLNLVLSIVDMAFHMNYAHGLASIVLCWSLMLVDFICVPRNIFSGTEVIICLPQSRWGNPDEYDEMCNTKSLINDHITNAKGNAANANIFFMDAYVLIYGIFTHHRGCFDDSIAIAMTSLCRCDNEWCPWNVLVPNLDKTGCRTWLK